MPAFIATVQLLIDAKDQAEACDGVSELLSGNALEDDNSLIVDWSYLKVGGQRLWPSTFSMGTIDWDTYEEGDFLNG